MKSKSVLRRLEQLEKRLQPQTLEKGGLLILDRQPTAKELEQIRIERAPDMIIVEDEVPD